MSTPAIRGILRSYAKKSALTLLVLGVGADHPHHALAAHNFTVFANPLDAASDFHGCFPEIRPLRRIVNYSKLRAAPQVRRRRPTRAPGRRSKPRRRFRSRRWCAR